MYIYIYLILNNSYPVILCVYYYLLILFVYVINLLIKLFCYNLVDKHTNTHTL